MQLGERSEARDSLHCLGFPLPSHVQSTSFLALSSTSMVKYLETAIPTESNPRPTLAPVAGTVISSILPIL